MATRVARFRHGKYGRFKENGNFHAKWHRTYSKMICRNTGDPVKYGGSGNSSGNSKGVRAMNFSKLT